MALKINDYKQDLQNYVNEQYKKFVGGFTSSFEKESLSKNEVVGIKENIAGLANVYYPQDFGIETIDINKFKQTSDTYKSSSTYFNEENISIFTSGSISSILKPDTFGIPIASISSSFKELSSLYFNKYTPASFTSGSKDEVDYKTSSFSITSSAIPFKDSDIYKSTSTYFKDENKSDFISGSKGLVITSSSFGIETASVESLYSKSLVKELGVYNTSSFISGSKDEVGYKTSSFSITSSAIPLTKSDIYKSSSLYFKNENTSSFISGSISSILKPDTFGIETASISSKTSTSTSTYFRNYNSSSFISGSKDEVGYKTSSFSITSSAIPLTKSDIYKSTSTYFNEENISIFTSGSISSILKPSSFGIETASVESSYSKSLSTYFKDENTSSFTSGSKGLVITSSSFGIPIENIPSSFKESSSLYFGNYNTSSFTSGSKGLVVASNTFGIETANINSDTYNSVSTNLYSESNLKSAEDSLINNYNLNIASSIILNKRISNLPKGLNNKNYTWSDNPLISSRAAVLNIKDYFFSDKGKLFITKQVRNYLQNPKWFEIFSGINENVPGYIGPNLVNPQSGTRIYNPLNVIAQTGVSNTLGPEYTPFVSNIGPGSIIPNIIPKLFKKLFSKNNNKSYNDKIYEKLANGDNIIESYPTGPKGIWTTIKRAADWNTINKGKDNPLNVFNDRLGYVDYNVLGNVGLYETSELKEYQELGFSKKSSERLSIRSSIKSSLPLISAAVNSKNSNTISEFWSKYYKNKYNISNDKSLIINKTYTSFIDEIDNNGTNSNIKEAEKKVILYNIERNSSIIPKKELLNLSTTSKILENGDTISTTEIKSYITITSSIEKKIDTSYNQSYTRSVVYELGNKTNIYNYQEKLKDSKTLNTDNFTLDKNNKDIDIDKEDTLLSFKIYSNDNTEAINFRAFITGQINSSYSTNWTPIQYVGRGEKFYAFSNIDVGQVSINFKLVAFKKEDVLYNKKKLNKLISYSMPSYINKNDSVGIIQGNYIKIKIGDLLGKDAIPSIINSVSYNAAVSSVPWETDSGKQLPHIFDVTLVFTPLFSSILSKDNFSELN